MEHGCQVNNNKHISYKLCQGTRMQDFKIPRRTFYNTFLKIRGK